MYFQVTAIKLKKYVEINRFCGMIKRMCKNSYKCGVGYEKQG